MKKQVKGFTLIELLVVISIIALLMSILMPSLAKVKDMARTLVDQAQVRSWSQFFFMYCESRDDKFPVGPASKDEGGWATVLYDYYKDSPDILLCPTTGDNKPDIYKTSGMSIWVSDGKGGYVKENLPYTKSYGASNWIYDVEANHGDFAYYWKKKNATRQPGEVPIFGDYGGITDVAMGAWPMDEDLPPNYPGEPQSANKIDGIRRFCMDRHNGYGCYSFMDGSARKVGMKELWTLKWHKNFNTRNIRTLANQRPDSETIAQWNTEAPHWRNYKVY